MTQITTRTNARPIAESVMFSLYENVHFIGAGRRFPEELEGSFVVLTEDREYLEAGHPVDDEVTAFSRGWQIVADPRDARKLTDALDLCRVTDSRLLVVLSKDFPERSLADWLQSLSRRAGKIHCVVQADARHPVAEYFGF